MKKLKSYFPKAIQNYEDIRHIPYMLPVKQLMEIQVKSGIVLDHLKEGIGDIVVKNLQD